MKTKNKIEVTSDSGKISYYDNVKTFTNGFAIVRKGEKWDCIDERKLL